MAPISGTPLVNIVITTTDPVTGTLRVSYRREMQGLNRAVAGWVDSARDGTQWQRVTGLTGPPLQPRRAPNSGPFL